MHNTMCNTCLHRAVCEYDNSTCYGDQCDYFEDRSYYIRMPFKIGDVVYVIQDDSIYSVIVKRFYQSESGPWKIAYVGDFLADSDFTDINKTVFYTKDDAENALK